MDVSEISKKYNVDKIVAEILIKRGIDTEDKLKVFLNPNDSCFHDPFLLKNMDLLVKRVKRAIEKKEKVLIFGDYDVDGVSASAILIKYFASIGFYVDYFLPNRYIDGYGLTIDTLNIVKSKYAPNLIITVDCGISCFEEVEYAKKIGIEIIVTDHHDIPSIIPDTIVVNPKLDGQDYPFKYLCGTGVAFKIVQALAGLNEAKKYLGIASIATIADIVPLLDENRAIVKLGMKDFENNLPLGIKMLFRDLGLPFSASSTDIAFKLAPKINAAGRMGDASVALMLYIKNDKIQLKNTIESITNMNAERQSLCGKVYDDAIAKLGKINISNYNSVILSSPDWDSGILGIVAARIANEFNRPTILFSEVDGLLKGSARSVNDIDIYAAISSLGEDVLETFGGHKMAAGLTIKKENFNKFLTKLNNYLSANYTPKDFLPATYYDVNLRASEINIGLLDSLEVLEPCGCENPKPVFNVKLDENSSFSAMPKHSTHVTMTSHGISIIAFNAYKYLPILRQTSDVQVQVELQKSEYHGQKMVKGITKNISTGIISKLHDDEFLRGIYLKQLYYNFEKHRKFYVYNSDELKGFLKQAEKELFGWLFVCNSFESYKEFCSLNLSPNIQHYMFEIIQKSGINSVVVSPIDTKNFGAYKKIVFLDMVLNEGYLGFVNSNTNALLYLPNSKNVDSKLFTNISLERGIFGKVFKLISEFASKQLSFLNEIDLYKHISLQDKKLKFSQFIFCLYVFIELNIFELVPELGFLSIKENKKVVSSLNASKFYNRVNFIKKTIQEKK